MNPSSHSCRPRGVLMESNSTVTDTADELCRLSACELVRRIAAGELSSRQVVEAHVQRCQHVNPKLNAIVVPRFEQALEAAKEADQQQAKGSPLGLLHGLPMTIKEMFDVQGLPTTAGITTRANHQATNDAPVVAALRNAGAIFLGKTNVPMMGLKATSDNPLYGSTKNPWNLSRSPGGSSGGEAAIISAAGSPLGLGSDGGGSIRHPCHSCGVAGLKPTGLRVAIDGHWTIPNWFDEWVQPGPMARHVDDLWLGLRAMIAAQSDTLDGSRSPIADFHEIDVRKLRVGVYTNLSWPEPCPAAVRAVNSAVEHLTNDGVDVVPFNPPDVTEVWGAFMGLFYADGFHFMRKQIRGAATDSDVRQLMQFTMVPNLLRPVLSWVFAKAGQRGMSETMQSVRRRVISARDYLGLWDTLRAYRRKFSAAMRQAEIDVIIAPPNPLPALFDGMFYANYSLLYTSVYNMLGFPAGVVPATRVNKDEETTDRGTTDLVERCFHECEKDSAGLPIGIQVASRWWREDLVLAVMKRLEEHFQRSDSFPTNPPI